MSFLLVYESFDSFLPKGLTTKRKRIKSGHIKDRKVNGWIGSERGFV